MPGWLGARAGWLRGAGWRTGAELTTSLQRPPANDCQIEQEPGGGRLPAARPPPGDYPGPRRRCAGGGPCGLVGGSRTHRPVDLVRVPPPVLHAAGRPLFTATCTTNRAAINRRRTAGPKVCTYGVHAAPRGLASPFTKAPESRRPVMEEESEAVRSTKNVGGRGLRANVCGERAGGFPLSVCGQRLPRVQRAAPHREPVGDFYLQKNRAWWVRHIRKYRGDERASDTPPAAQHSRWPLLGLS